MISGLIFLGVLLAVIIGGTIAVAIDSKRHPWLYASHREWPSDPSSD